MRNLHLHIYGLNDNSLTTEIIKELTALSDTDLVIIRHILAWTKRVGTNIPDSQDRKCKRHQEFDAINACSNYAKQMHAAQRQTMSPKQNPYNSHPHQWQQVPQGSTKDVNIVVP